MSMFTLHQRAFHPDKNFGVGGLFFKGDNRGFSNVFDRSRIKSRVGSFWKIDTLGGVIANKDDPNAVYSDFSEAPWGTTSSYSDEDTRPTGKILNFSASPYNRDSLQSINFHVHTRGKNHAFTEDPDFNNRWVPDLDIQVHLAMIIDRHKEEITITSNLLGDGFPNAEVFIVDSAKTSLMLNTHHRMGFAAGQLVANHNHLLGGTMITIGIDSGDNFIGPIAARRCVDFMPDDRDLLIEDDNLIFPDTYDTDYSLTEWNDLHIKRDPSEKYLFGLLDTDDILRAPEYPTDGMIEIDDFFDEPKAHDLPNWNH